MSAILYWLVIKPISKLPYPLLYVLSDFFFVVLYYLVGYRKKVVTDNLVRCFPEKSENEIKSLRKKFFRHFCDLVLESLKNFSITLPQTKARMKQVNYEIFAEYKKKGKAVILGGGHYCNWELWAVASPGFFPQRLVGIYKRLSNAYFDKKMRKTRGKFGLELISTREFGNFLQENHNDLIVSVLAVDQSPADPKKCVWIPFFGQETATHFGAEKYAKEYDLPVVFAFLTKVKRGFYEVRYEKVTDNPREYAHGQLTYELNRMLEEHIRKKPEFWLWSHKRWKHKRPLQENFQENEPKS